MKLFTFNFRQFILVCVPLHGLAVPTSSTNLLLCNNQQNNGTGGACTILKWRIWQDFKLLFQPVDDSNVRTELPPTYAPPPSLPSDTTPGMIPLNVL